MGIDMVGPCVKNEVGMCPVVWEAVLGTRCGTTRFVSVTGRWSVLYAHTSCAEDSLCSSGGVGVAAAGAAA